MSALTPVTYLTVSGDHAWSHITDLDIIRFGGVDVLVSVTRYDGRLQSWNIDGTAMTAGAQLALDGGDVAGGGGAFAALSGPAGPLIVTGGGSDGAFQQQVLGAQGWQLTATLPAHPGFGHLVSTRLGSGAQMIYGALAAGDGIASWRFDGAGALIGAGPRVTGLGQVSALLPLDDWLFSLDASNRLTVWQVDHSGNLTMGAQISTDDGLWIAQPSALASAQLDGSRYLIVAASGSSSISVIEHSAQGDLIIRDHVLDTLHTRFGGVSAIASVSDQGRHYIIAGGADDGISVFLLMSGGQLHHLAQIADTTAIGLDNISAITARGRAGGLDIFVASSSESGITQLRYDAGPAGITAHAAAAGAFLLGSDGNDILHGWGGDDTLSGGAGNDTLHDGAGTDVMTGGAGADLFILSHDGMTDWITDFTLGIDRLDLSQWPLLRDISQLTMAMTQTGFRITYGDEDLWIDSADGAPIDYRLLTNADILGTMRLPNIITAGFAGPPRPAPPLTPPSEPLADQGGPNSVLTGLRALASGNLVDLRSALSGAGAPAQAERVVTGGGTGGNLTGTARNDVLLGRAGADVLHGGSGDDLLLGRAGNDTLLGGAGADILLGGSGHDSLQGGDGHDLLMGEAGNDTLAGGFGDDTLIGGAGADLFIFDHGNDIILDFDQTVDRITLDARLWTGLTNADDVLRVYGSIDGQRATLDFGNGNTLIVDGVSDYALFADALMLF